ncbi:hypothetical protein ACFS6G_10520 [Peribacillus deserti]
MKKSRNFSNFPREKVCFSHNS